MPAGTPSGSLSLPESDAATSDTAAPGGFVMPGLVAGNSAADSAAEKATKDSDAVNQVASDSEASEPAAVTASTKQGDVKPVSGYTPGSTAGATSYPTKTTGSSSDEGSFYR